MKKALAKKRRRVKRVARAPAAKAGRRVKRIVSIPDEVVLAPQTERPRHLLGADLSGRRSKVRELTWIQFDRLIGGLAKGIQQKGVAQVVVGVAHGGVFAGGAIASALGVEFFPVRISRRSRDQAVRTSPKMSGQMPKELKGKRVLIVDDVAASGETLELATQLARKVGAAQVHTAALVAREGAFAPDFCALTTEDFLVFPWDYQTLTEDARFDVDPDKAGA